MIIIVVTGSIGSGKTSLLTDLAEWCKLRGKRVEGFVATASDREAPGRGAESYRLTMLDNGRELEFAVRDATRTPPYRFDEQTMADLQAWSESLAGQSRPDMIILDEFGPLEGAGGGHMALWPAIKRSHPDVVVIAVRTGLERQIEERLGVSFHAMISAEHDTAADELRRACVEAGDWSRVGMYGAASGGFEASVGAALHGTQVPLRGLFLSSVQSAIMTYAGDGLGHRARVVWVPFIAASIKALSPSGNRLRPMLAITVQGILYTLSVLLFGWNVVGVVAGGFLIGAWSAVQGVALQYLFVGSDLVRAYDAVIGWIAGLLHLTLPGMVTLFGLWAIVCGLVGGGATLLAWNRRHHLPLRLRALLARGAGRALAAEPTRTPGRALLRGLRDLLRPVFWVPVLVVVAVLKLTGTAWDSAMWVVIRAAGIGFVVFSLASAFNPHRFVAWLKRKGFRGPALAFEQAVRKRKEEGDRG